ncbi:MAG: galactokinase [Ilumatobacteraceae bacterium]|nr:galactokinase [Ilumatobacteraceae bacterium]
MNEAHALTQGTVWAPGRVNLIGDHTDYTGGFVLPIAIDLGTTITWHSTNTSSQFRSDVDDVIVDLDVVPPPSHWGKYVHAVALLLQQQHVDPQIFGTISSTLPIGSGLSSSASLEIAVALSLGATARSRDGIIALAKLCQQAEHAATGVPCGIMDQLIVLAGQSKHALLIDCSSLDMTPVCIPDNLKIVVQFIAHRTLARSAYSDRVAQCTLAQEIIGPLRSAKIADLVALDDPVIQKRALHVITENVRVNEFCSALASGDFAQAGSIMTDSHNSLRDNFDVSTAQMDAAVHAAHAIPGVYGARMTGGGFGGCIVAIADVDAPINGWTVQASDGARLIK